MLAAKGDKKGAVQHASMAIEQGKKDEAPPEELDKLQKQIDDWNKSM